MRESNDIAVPGSCDCERVGQQDLGERVPGADVRSSRHAPRTQATRLSIEAFSITALPVVDERFEAGEQVRIELDRQLIQSNRPSRSIDPPSGGGELARSGG